MHGLQEGDWIWDSHSLSLVDYDDFVSQARTWAKQNIEPLRLAVLRLDKTVELDSIESQLTIKPQPPTAFSPLMTQSPVAAAAGAAAAKMSCLPSFQANVLRTNPSLVKPKPVQASIIKPMKPIPTDILVSGKVPFCKKCNGTGLLEK